MEHYVTLFNSLFLPQGLALHRSMERHISNYALWILCVDDLTYGVLDTLNLPNVRLLQLSRLETEALLRVKSERTIGEYCWTLTPFSPKFVFESDSSVERVTYLDADLWFRKHPAPIFRELDAAKKAVLITDHGYAPECDQSATSGQYCVQFMTFCRGGGETVRQWWEARCIEWCYSRFEDGKFGDQKYLDDWPERFGETVHVLENKELALAPWNAGRFPYGQAIFYHFHQLRIISNESIHIGVYSLPKVLIRNVHFPYFADLRSAASALADIGFQLQAQAAPLKDPGLARKFYRGLRRLYRTVMLEPPSQQLPWTCE
jgi:hypothetical protein